MFFFFFFQAEDGIRDVAVTGVQTCALPISEELLAQALESLRRAGLEPSLTETTPDGGAVASTDYRAASGLVVRRGLIQGAGHAWTGGAQSVPLRPGRGRGIAPASSRYAPAQG